jgi:hypothetical protein
MFKVAADWFHAATVGQLFDTFSLSLSWNATVALLSPQELSLDSILSQFHPVHTFMPHFNEGR